MGAPRTEAVDWRSGAVLASFLCLIGALALCVPFTFDRAETNMPLRSAVLSLID